jgi:hypothetical protein
VMDNAKVHRLRMIGATAAFGCALALGLAPTLSTDARAQGRWCAESGGRGAYQNCGYYTYQQCREAVSGVGGFCRPNSYPEAYGGMGAPYGGNEGYSYGFPDEPYGYPDRPGWRR